MVFSIRSWEAGAGPHMLAPSRLTSKNLRRSKSFMSFGKGSSARDYLRREGAGQATARAAGMGAGWQIGTRLRAGLLRQRDLCAA